jgi:hypothetical protein
MRPTSSVKELGAILQKLINLDKIQNENETNDGRLALLAMRMNLCLATSVVGSVQQRKRICSYKNWKKNRFKLRWLKESY